VPVPEFEKSMFEALLARRSVRKYKPRKVEAQTINNLLEAAVRAPTALGQEPWAFVIIQDKILLKSLSDYAKPLFLSQIHQHQSKQAQHKLDLFNRPDFNIFHDANTLIVICGKTAAPFFSADCWLAAENMMLAACAMNLGSCVIGSALSAFEVPEVRTKLRIPDSYSAVAPIVIGYPDEKNTPSSRKNPVVFSCISAP
jgi:nitroreductase